MYKMFIVDLDDTLLNEKKKISEIDKKAIKKLRDSGILFTVFTGREYHLAKDYIEELDIDIPFVLHNGALITNREKEIFLKKTISREDTVKIIKEAKKNNLNVFVHSNFIDLPDLLTDFDLKTLTPFTPFLLSQIDRIEIVDDLIGAVEKTKGAAHIAVNGYEKNIINLIKSTQNQMHGKIEWTYTGTIEDWSFHQYYWNIFPEKEKLHEMFDSELHKWGYSYLSSIGVTKGEALDYFLDKFNLKEEEVAFIGDGYNDIPLMKRVGMPIAVANAVDDVKSVSKMTVNTNKKNGVSEAIKRLFFNK